MFLILYLVFHIFLLIASNIWSVRKGTDVKKNIEKALPSPWMLPTLHLWFSMESLALISQQLLYLCSFRGGGMVQSSLQRISSWNRNYKGGLASGYDLTNLFHRHCAWQDLLTVTVAEKHAKSLPILCDTMPQVIPVPLHYVGVIWG